MRYSNPIRSVLLLLAVLAFPFFSFSQIISTPPRFEIHAYDDHLKQEVRGILQSSYGRMSRFLEDSLTETVTVYVVDSEEEFVSKVGRGFPEWGIACAVPARNLIVLKSPLRFEYHRPFAQVVNHELAHVFLGRLSRGKRIPRWLDEGFAMYQSQEWRIGQDVAVARAVITGSILPLSQIESVNAFRESKAQLAYTESFLAVSYLYREFGEGTVRELVTHLASGSSMDIAFIRTIGSNYLSFQLEFEKYVETKYNWLSLLGDTIVVWIGLAFLFIFLYFLKLRGTRKKLEEWKQQEESAEREDGLPESQTQN